MKEKKKKRHTHKNNNNNSKAMRCTGCEGFNLLKGKKDHKLSHVLNMKNKDSSTNF